MDMSHTLLDPCFMDALEDLDDVQKAFTNADFPPEVLERYGSS